MKAAIIGFAGSLSLALSAVSSGFSYQQGWPWPPMAELGHHIARRPDAALYGLAGVILIAIAWWLAKDTTKPGRLFILWSVPLLFVPPVMTADPFAYADAAWVAFQGANPYHTPVATLGGPYASGVDPMWRGTTVPYPPMGVLLSVLAAASTGFHPYFGVIAQRALVLIGLWAVWWLIPRLVPPDRVAVARWLGLLNPLTISQGVGGAHNDFVMAAIAFSAVAVAASRRENLGFFTGSLLAGLAMGVKPQAGLVVLAVAALTDCKTNSESRHWLRLWRLGWRSAVSSVICLSAFLVLSLPWGFGWAAALGQASSARTPTIFFLGRDLLNEFSDSFGFGGGHTLTTWALVILMAGAAVLVTVIWRYIDRPILMVVVGSLIVVLVNPGFLAWYLALPLLLGCVLAYTYRQLAGVGAVVTGVTFMSMTHYMLGTGLWPRTGFGLAVGFGCYLLTQLFANWHSVPPVAGKDQPGRNKPG